MREFCGPTTVRVLVSAAAATTDVGEKNQTSRAKKWTPARKKAGQGLPVAATPAAAVRVQDSGRVRVKIIGCPPAEAIRSPGPTTSFRSVSRFVLGPPASMRHRRESNIQEI